MAWKDLRRWTTARLSAAALRLARLLPAGALRRLERGLARLGPRLPILSRIAAENMRAAGVFSPAAHAAYFEQVARHLAGAMSIWGAEPAPSGAPAPGITAAMDATIELDESVATLSELARRGGVVLIGPHIANFLLITPCVSRVTPLTVFLRYSKDARRRTAKARWAQAVGVATIAEQARAGDADGRFARMTAAIRAGQTLYVTPDLPQKRGTGRAVRLGRLELDLPAGPALLAARTAAPVVLMSAESGAAHRPGEPGRTRIVFTRLSAGSRSSPRATAAAIHQQFADALERFLHEQTPLWFFWCDKRWTRVFRGDPRFVTQHTADERP